jgi:hypothetical protein
MTERTRTVPDAPGDAFAHLLGAFLLPILDDLRSRAVRDGAWLPGGPWR